MMILLVLRNKFGWYLHQSMIM